MTTTTTTRPKLPPAFFILWAGQSLSIIGSGMTTFAMSVLTYQRHRSIAEYALVVLCYSLPGVLAAGPAGTLLDRFDRKRVLALGALGAGACTLLIALQAMVVDLQRWQICLCAVGMSFFGAAQLPAVNALTASLVDGRHYPRANGLWQVSTGLTMVVAPLLASHLLGKAGIAAILAADCCTYLVAIAALPFVRVPALALHRGAARAQGGYWRALAAGWRYVGARPALVRLLLALAVTQVAVNMLQLAVVPIALAHGDAHSLSYLMGVSAAGFIAGAAVMALWGGPARRVFGVYGGGLVLGAGLVATGLCTNLTAVACGLFVITMALPAAFSCDTALWQAKTDAAWHGRVFALTSMVTQATQPLACLLVPLLATLIDKAERATGPLSWALHAAGGTGPGRAEGIVLALVGLLLIGLVALATRSPRLRRIDLELPDVATGPRAAAPATTPEPR